MSSQRPPLYPAQSMSDQEIKDEQQYEAHMSAAENYHIVGDTARFKAAQDRAEYIGSQLDPPRDAKAEFEERLNSPNSDVLCKQIDDRDTELRNVVFERHQETKQYDRDPDRDPNYQPNPEWEYHYAKDHADIIRGLDINQESSDLVNKQAQETSRTAIEVERELNKDKDKDEPDR